MKSTRSSLMEILNRFRLRPIAITLISVIVAVGFVASSGARGWLRVKVTETQQNPTTSDSSVGAELVTIKRFGFEPAEITRPHGSFVLEVDNRAEVTAVDLRLERVGHEPTREVHIPREKLDWIEILPDLPAGDYLLTEANHPDWVCRITITK
jgi:hypothetical protein